MRRRSLTAGVLAAIITPLGAQAQQAGKLPTVGLLWTSSRAVTTGRDEAFQQQLRTHGYVDGRTIVIEHRWADGAAEILPQLVADLLRLKVDVIVTSGTTAIRAAKAATDTTSIVMAGGGDPVGTGLIKSLARPEGNITGVSLIGEEILVKGLELFTANIPRVTRVAVLMNAANPANAFFFGKLEAAARPRGIQLRRVDARSAADFEAIIGTLTGGGLQVLADPLFEIHLRRIAALAVRNGVPMLSVNPSAAKAGALMTYGVHWPDIYRRAADYVMKLLKGAKPADLPVEQPEKFVLVINLNTAKALGVTIPPSLLARADEVIE